MGKVINLDDAADTTLTQGYCQKNVVYRDVGQMLQTRRRYLAEGLARGGAFAAGDCSVRGCSQRTRVQHETCSRHWKVRCIESPSLFQIPCRPRAVEQIEDLVTGRWHFLQ